MCAYIGKKNDIGRIVKPIKNHGINVLLNEQFIERIEIIMKYKWVIMQELEDTNCASPYLIVDSEKRAEELCYQLESENPGFIFWSYLCEEE